MIAPKSGAPPTHADLARDGASILAKAGIEAPLREARLLLALATDQSAAELIAMELDPVSGEEAYHRYREYLSRRVRQEPFAHIAGVKEFYGLPLKSDRRALVPRADSECVVDRALEYLSLESCATVADLGTGSGCLLAAILSQRPEVKGTAIEADAGAIELAGENFETCGISARIDLRNMPWQDWQGWAEADLIISNPPYIREGELDQLDEDVRLFDPIAALNGGADGLDCYRSIISLVVENAKAGTLLIFEIGFDQASAIEAMLRQHGFSEIKTGKDLAGHDRVVSSRSPSAKSSN
ncbi:MAG: peptide chain release factor N(5)-glutamine methyltransferase [Pseudomonadota bacterium]